MLLVSLDLLLHASIGYLTVVAIGTRCNLASGSVALPVVGIRSLTSIGCLVVDVTVVRSVVSIGCLVVAAIIVRYVASIGSLAHAAIGFRSLASVPLLSLLSQSMTPQYVFYFYFGYLERFPYTSLYYELCYGIYYTFLILIPHLEREYNWCFLVSA